MFLIAKIVRGRRLLQELEAAEAAAAAAAAKAEKETNNNEEPEPSSSTAAAAAGTATTGVIRKISHVDPRSGGSSSAAGSAAALAVEPRSLSETPRLARRKRFTKTVRNHPTTASFGSDGLETGAGANAVSPIPGGPSGMHAMRRTSSMPSVSDQPIPARRHFYDYNAKLNKLQKRALRFTWHRLHTRNGGKRVETVFEEVYERLARQVPQMRELFTTRTFLCAMGGRDVAASLRAHAGQTVRMLDFVIGQLDNPGQVARQQQRGDDVACDPRAVGRAHAALRPYGVTGLWWEKWGETVVDVVLAQEAVRDLPGAAQAWVVLTACCVDQLRAGFDEARHTIVAAAAAPSPCPVAAFSQGTMIRSSPQPILSTGENQDLSSSSEFICPASQQRRRVSRGAVLPATPEEPSPFNAALGAGGGVAPARLSVDYGHQQQDVGLLSPQSSSSSSSQNQHAHPMTGRRRATLCQDRLNSLAADFLGQTTS